MALCSTLSMDLISQMQNVKLVSIVQTLMVITYIFKQIGCNLEEKLIEASVNNDCIRPCDTVTYECTVAGSLGGVTLWAGDFFVRCSSGERVMELRHSPTQVGETAKFTDRTCNNGSIVGRIIRAENGSYTSQLNVTLTSDIVGRSIECAHDNGTIHKIGSLNLTMDLDATYLLPKNISLTFACPLPDVQFNWGAFPPVNCPATHIYYKIRASGCGSCPNITNEANINCTDEPIYDGRCEFSVQSVFSLHSKVYYSEWQNKSLMISRCPGENGFRNLIMAIILPLTMLILLAIVAPLSYHIYKKKLLTSSCKSSRQITLHRNDQYEEQEIGNYYGRKPLAEDDSKEATRIFDNQLNGMYNLEEPDVIQSEQIQESVQGDPIPLNLNTLLIKLEEHVSSHWYKFGLAIGIPDDMLEELKDYSDKNALVEILDYWLKNNSYQPTWEDVGTALRKAGFNEINVD